MSRLALAALVAGALGIAAPARAAGQVDPPPAPGVESVSVVPGERYAAGGVHRALVGAGHRDLWTTEIRVPVADMGALGGGGLTPIELGGGTTTQTLHLRGADGRRYVFRSVDKTPRELLEDLEGTPAEAIIQDQMSAFHPSGAVVVARLLEAVGLLHPEPRLMVVPDDPRLEEFQEQFAGMLVLFEERPDDLPEGEAGFAGSTRIVQTDDLFDELEESPENRLVLDELLRGRLIDILIGDRDRSVNNHLWARFEDGDGYLWRPIPRDRDQAFVQFDGLLKAIARWYEPRLVPFGEDYAKTTAVTRNAWDIDRNLLVGVGRPAWDRAVADAQAAITDDVIADAVARMPPEHFALMGEDLARALRARRDDLPTVAEDLYDIVFRFADIHATDQGETASIERLAGGAVRVEIQAEEGGGPYFARTFVPSETSEIRLYMHGGDDRVTAAGGASPITVRVLGGGGADAVENEPGSELSFYDAGDQSTVSGPGVRHIDESPSRPWSWFEESYDLDWGSTTILLPGMSYDSDRGLVPTASVRYQRHGFDRLPFAYQLDVRAGWAVAHEEPILESSILMREAVGGADLALSVRFSGIEVVNFFGLGNETQDDADDRFYKVDQEHLAVGASLRWTDGTRNAWVGPFFSRVVSDTLGAPTALSQTRPLGTGTFAEVGLRSGMDWDRRDAAVFPTGGFHLGWEAAFVPAFADVEDTFSWIRGEGAAYLSPSGGNPTLAVRAGGMKVWGDAPYFERALLGGSGTLRGLREERYAGDGMLFANAEVRASLARITVLLPIEVGAFGFTDVGRVYLDGEDSSEWHSGAGGGLWFAPLDRRTTVRISTAWAEGRQSFYAGLGFAF